MKSTRRGLFRMFLGAGAAAVGVAAVAETVPVPITPNKARGYEAGYTLEVDSRNIITGMTFQADRFELIDPNRPKEISYIPALRTQNLQGFRSTAHDMYFR